MKAKVITLLRICFISLLHIPLVSFAYVDDYSVETFYKDATYAHFVKSLTETYSYHYSCDPTNAKLITYATHVLRKHPDYAMSLVADFGLLESCQQQVVCASLKGAGQHNAVNAINEKYNNVCSMNDSVALINAAHVKFLDKIETAEDEKQQAMVMDACWAAYFATGDETYIIKMVDYAKTHQGQSEHAQTIAEFVSVSMVHAQNDPKIDEIIAKQTHHCPSCFR